MNPDAVESGISIVRRLFDAKGAPVPVDGLRQGETYRVTWELDCEQAVDHVVVADLLPAGLEVENPRIDEGALAAVGLKDAGTAASYLDIRDDRLVVSFDRLKAGKSVYHYVGAGGDAGDVSSSGRACRMHV